MIYILILIQFASHKAQVIEANELCANIPHVIVNYDSGLVCVPVDVIFSDGFES